MSTRTRQIIQYRATATLQRPQIKQYTTSKSTEYQSWPLPLTSWPKINRVPPLIIHNFYVKFKSDLVRTAVCIVSKRSYTQSAKVDLYLWACSSSHHQQPTWEVWKWLGKNCSSHRVHKLKRDGPMHILTYLPMHAPLVHPTTHVLPHYYIPSNAVARGKRLKIQVQQHNAQKLPFFVNFVSYLRDCLS